MVALSGDAESVILNGLLSVILIVATVSNSLLLLVFYRRPGLRTISNRFVINLLVTNLITCWILLPMMLLDNIWWRKGNTDMDASLLVDQYHSIALCILFEGAAIGLCVACVLSVVMIGVDQYFAVIDPLRYHSSIKATTSVIMVAISWTLAIVFGIFGSLSMNRSCAWYVCEQLDGNHPPLLPEYYQLAFAVLFVAFAFVAPFVAICRIYLSICSAARENHQRTKRHGSASNCVQEAALLDYTIASTIHEFVEFDANDVRRQPMETLPAVAATKPLHHSSTKSSLKSTSSSIVNSLRHRISNASMFRYREETRAARISVLVIVMALFCWLPFTILLVIRSPLLGGHIALPHYVKQIGILSLSSNAVVSPLIFAHRNRRIHRELCRLFRISKRRSSFYDNADSVCRRRNLFKKRPMDSWLSATAAAAASAIVEAAAVNNESFVVPATTTGTAVVNAAAIAATTATATTNSDDDESCACQRVSILNRVWHLARETDRRRRKMLRLPEVAFETDTSRSSFSSNASTGSNHRSTSAASFSDAAEEI